MLQVIAESTPLRPLEYVTIRGAHDGAISVRDGLGREYARVAAQPDGVQVRVGGALGTHVVLQLDSAGCVVEEATFKVDCSSWIEDDDGRFSSLLGMLFHTMRTWNEGPTWVRLGGKYYKYYVCWLRDHVHTLKGMKYFDGVALQSGIELYADYQREDGMIWDRFQRYSPYTNWRDFTFSYGGFVRKVENDEWRFERIPVENDVEYLFIEGLYYTWKATGDDGWMRGLLDSAIKACRYSTTDPYRWSERYQLLKRGFTIDTWDFQSAEDAARVEGGAMVIDKDKTRFGVMHGDNTGFIAACRYLAEMLDRAQRSGEAATYRNVAESMQRRLDEVAWNGEFYTHHVPEDTSVQRDLGVDTSRQVSLSNAYALNRGIDHEKCKAIIETYQRIRNEMPPTSPGEFYQIYPPFEKGFGGHNRTWHYMNGGVTTIVAGELAHGAFEHGFERYAVDILDRVKGWGEAHGGYLDCCYRGAAPEEPETTYETLDIRDAANADIVGTEGGPVDGVIGWTDEGENDLREFSGGRQEFFGIPFEIAERTTNGRRACIGLSTRPHYVTERSLLMGGYCRSLYFLHTCNAGSGVAGVIELHYTDGSRHVEYIYPGRQIGNWFMPSEPAFGGNGKLKTTDVVYRLAWRGGNPYFPNVGVYAYGLNNPHPEKEVRSVALRAAETSVIWFVHALTSSDQPVLFPTNDISFGIPDNWGAGAVVYALFEGLAGVKDTGCAFDTVTVSPRWTAAGTSGATVTAKYEASGGYVRYRYDAGAEHITLDLTTSATETQLEVLLPEGVAAQGVRVDGEQAEHSVKGVEDSRYLCVRLSGVGVRRIEIDAG